MSDREANCGKRKRIKTCFRQTSPTWIRPWESNARQFLVGMFKLVQFGKRLTGNNQSHSRHKTKLKV